MALNKADLLRKKANPEEVFIEALGDSVRLAPLSNGQYAQVETIQMAGIKARGRAKQQDPEMEFDISEVNKNQKEASVLAVWFSLHTANPEDGWSQEDVKNLSPEVVAALAKEVFRLTGVSAPSLPESVAQFRGDDGGSGAS